VRASNADAAGKSFGANQWGKVHADKFKHAMTFAGMDKTPTMAAGIALIIEGLATYADGYHAEYGDDGEGFAERYAEHQKRVQDGDADPEDAVPSNGHVLANDGILGEAWADMLKGCRTLLNGDLGGLDGGTLDSILCKMAEANGYEVNDL
jgi:hypothetical protein